MAHVPPLDKSDASAEAQETLAAIENKLGGLPNFFKTAAHQPDVLKGIATLDAGIKHDLPARLRELAYFKASQLNGCAYCMHYHKQAASGAGVSKEQLAGIDHHAGSGAFDEHEQAVLDYAEQLTRTANVEKSTVERLKTFLDDKQLVALAATVALANFTNRLNHGLDIELP